MASWWGQCMMTAVALRFELEPVPDSEQPSAATSGASAGANASARANAGAGAEDAALVAAALRAEPRAEEQLYRRHAPAVLAIATRLLGRSGEAEDVAQDSFVIAFERLAQLERPALFRGWVVRIAVSQVHRRFRRRKLLRALGLDRGEDDASLANLAQPSLDAETRADLARVDAALQRLPAAERVAFVLRHVEGYEHAEAAALCDCSLATIKRRLQRAETSVRALSAPRSDEPRDASGPQATSQLNRARRPTGEDAP
ncbi:MAG TPA: sigma-70 family RNA polymerase sigma factor [Polyangiales bacterium]|nr:sigma-70 family RNA polymerase sigma factor [Polyangiales bacterium]